MTQRRTMSSKKDLSTVWTTENSLQGGIDSRSEGFKNIECNVDSDRTKRSRIHFGIFSKSWQDWASCSTLHGIKFVFDPKSSLPRRLFWFFLVGGFIYALTVMCITQSVRFLQYKTATKTTMELEKNLTFPAVTICNFNLIRNDSITDSKTRELLMALFMLEPNRSYIENLDEEFLESVSIREIMAKGSPSVNDTFRLCFWLGEFIECEKLLTRKARKHGHCDTFGSSEDGDMYTVQTTGFNDGLTLTIWLNQDNYFIGDGYSAGIRVIIHDPSEEPDYRFGLTFSPGYAHYISLRKKETIFLPSPVKAFGNRECVDTKSDTFKNPLEYFENYSTFACLMECSSKYIQTTCGCTATFARGDYPECNPLQLLNCVHEASKNFTTIFDTESCKCPLPCHVVNYKTTVSSSYFPNANFLKIFYGDSSMHQQYRDNLLQIRVNYETLVTKREEQILEFTQDDLIASFGGFLGLAVGASLITVLEILELLITSLFNCIKRK